MDDPLVGEDNIVGERRLEGTLRVIDGLRTGSISWICLYIMFRAFCAGRDRERCGWVWHGWRGEGMSGQCGN